MLSHVVKQFIWLSLQCKKRLLICSCNQADIQFKTIHNYQHKYLVFNHKYQPAINFVVVLIKTGLHILT